MKYYYLKDDDVIQVGDEFSDPTDNLGWWWCASSVGHTVERSLKKDMPNVQVRRKIRTTKLGNII